MSFNCAIVFSINKWHSATDTKLIPVPLNQVRRFQLNQLKLQINQGILYCTFYRADTSKQNNLS